MLLLVLGLVLFLTVHLVPTSPSLRDGLVERFGETAFKIAFSVLALAGFVLIVLGYHKLQLMPGKNPVLWDPPSWTRHIAFLLMLPAMIFLVAAYVPSRIRSAVKHPMLAAVKAWALSHLLVNGDLGSLALFGSFLAYAVYDRISLKSRPEKAPGPPPAGILNDLMICLVGLGLYGLIMTGGHAAVIGPDLVQLTPYQASAYYYIAALATLASAVTLWAVATLSPKAGAFAVMLLALAVVITTFSKVYKLDALEVGCVFVEHPSTAPECMSNLVYYGPLAAAALLALAGIYTLSQTGRYSA